MSSVLRGVNTALSAVGIESTTIQSLGGAPNVDPLGETYYSVTPFRFGDYIAKFSVAPASPDLLQLTGHQIDASDRPDAIRETIQAEMQAIVGVWDFRFNSVATSNGNRWRIRRWSGKKTKLLS